MAKKAKTSKQAKDGKKLRRSNNVLSRRNNDRSISIIRLDEDEYIYSVHGLAATCWELINNRRTTEEILEQVRKNKSVPPRFASDLNKFVKYLLKEKLVVQK